MVKAARKGNRRIDRVGDLVRSTLADIFLKGLADPRVRSGLVTVTDVDVSPDLRHAMVWVSIIGDEQAQADALAGLAAAAGFLRRELGQRISTKYTPALRFQRDKSAEEGAWVETTLADLDIGPQSEDDDAGSEQEET